METVMNQESATLVDLKDATAERLDPTELRRTGIVASGKAGLANSAGEYVESSVGLSKEPLARAMQVLAIIAWVGFLVFATVRLFKS